jgi:hypothetical protein
MSKIKRIVENIFRIPGSATLEEISRVADGAQLPVEPFSKTQPIADFILEGGTGYYSLVNGSLAEHVYEIRASYNGESFTYGLPFSTLYATGYPLARIIEGSRGNTLIRHFDKIDYISLPLSEKRDTVLLWKRSAYASFEPPPFSLNALYLNRSAAKLFGLKDDGFCVVLPKGTEQVADGWELLEHSIWENRFFMDTLTDTAPMSIFTQKSTSLDIYATLGEMKLSGLFVAVFTKKGILIKITGSAQQLDQLWERIRDQDYTYKLD